MAFERNNSARDFETMLRSHLVEANRLASPCSAFDPELANAYIEGALSDRLRKSYEGHLAECSTCRHAVVVLHKMSPVESSAMPPEAAGWWQSIREALTRPAWGLGFAAAAGAVLIAFGVYAVRQPNSATGAASQEIAMTSSESVPATGASLAPSAVPTAGEGGLNRSEPRRGAEEHRERVQPRAETSLPVIAAAPSASLIQPPAAPKPENEVKSVAPPAETQAPAAVQTEGRAQAESRKEEVRQDTLRSPAASQVAQTQERQIDDKGARRLTPRESAKAKPQATPPPRSNEDENFHPLIRKVRDKSFRFDRGIWIDQEYKPENRLQKTRLSRGTPDFDRVLSENPALAPFFDLGAVIVVWQGRVYEVRMW